LHTRRCEVAYSDALFRLTARLIARRDALRRTLDDDLSRFRRFSEGEGVGDSVDAADKCADDEICSQLVELESRELLQIERALERIAAGVYGRCELCGARIPAARLSALPYTTTCIDCQRKSERQWPRHTPRADLKPWARLVDSAFDEIEDDTEIDARELDTGFATAARHSLLHAMA
jgi:DnaK suppressor protein